MSPEQCQGLSPIDSRADVYALGVVLFEMLTGMVPFGGEGFVPILMKHISVPPPAARSIVPGLPASLDSILFRSLAKTPTQRFQSMREFREALLDPERYGAADPAPSSSSPDLLARVQEATPMARIVPRRASSPEAGPLEDPGLGQSTFRDSAGEVWTREGSSTAKPKIRRIRALLIATGAAGALAAGVKYRHQTTHFLDGAASIASSVRRPAQVRMTFNSDPEGATVDRADGTLLGVTPLVTDVPYRDVATEYIFRKAGYRTRTVAFLRDTPSPLFVVMQQTAGLPSPLPTPSPTPAPTPTVEEASSAVVDPRPARKRPLPRSSSHVEAVPMPVPVPLPAPVVRSAPPPVAEPGGDSTMDPTER
jgi:hypothetical protein